MVDRVSYGVDRVIYGSDLVTYDEAGVLPKSVTANLDANITSLATTKSVTASLDANILAPTAKSLPANFNALVQVLRIVVTANLDAAVGEFVIGGACDASVAEPYQGRDHQRPAPATWCSAPRCRPGTPSAPRSTAWRSTSSSSTRPSRRTRPAATSTIMTRTSLLRGGTGAVERSTAGGGQKVDFTAGNKRVAITVNALTLLNLTLYRGSGRTIFEGTDWTPGGEFQINLSEPTHRSLVVAGATHRPACSSTMTVRHAAASDQRRVGRRDLRREVEFGRTSAGHRQRLDPGNVVLRAPGDWLVAKVIGSTIKSWELRHRGDFQMVEDTIPGALTVDGRHIGRMLRYTGAGHTWTLNQAGMVGSVSVVNDGTGPITILNGSATISGALEIPAGSKGEIIYSQQGAHATTLSEKMRLSTGTSAAVPFSPQTPFSINQLLATSGPIPAAGFGIWPNSGQDETARILAALTALANEGPAALVGGRKRSLVSPTAST